MYTHISHKYVHTNIHTNMYTTVDTQSERHSSQRFSLVRYMLLIQNMCVAVTSALFLALLPYSGAFPVCNRWACFLFSLACLSGAVAEVIIICFFFGNYLFGRSDFFCF